ncbi:probable palmitoyltransferase ZDHHC24 [Pleurodeles waltl]|uniref:probable palmitoyltransferase ZDHHC24 n=1 Tax=Pleurodeles waltl TaxID=8319 RepID=UPI003709A5FD
MGTKLTSNSKRFKATLYLPLCITLGMITFVALEVFLLHVQEQETILDWFRAGHLLLMSFLLLNTFGNVVKFLRTNPSIKGVLLTDCSVGQGWDFCYSCEIHVPPRCQHCYNCNVCILRRDHHCVLLGQCQGHANYRYLMGFLIYCWAGLLYATLFNAENFTNILHEGVSIHSFLLLLMPWLMLVTGQISASTFVFAFVADICVVGLLFCSGFLALQTALLFRGATSKEWYCGQRCYDLGWRHNVREFLGTRWFLIWLSPWIASPLPGDGIHFETRSPPVQQLLKTPEL